MLGSSLLRGRNSGSKMEQVARISIAEIPSTTELVWAFNDIIFWWDPGKIDADVLGK